MRSLVSSKLAHSARLPAFLVAAAALLLALPAIGDPLPAEGEPAPDYNQLKEPDASPAPDAPPRASSKHRDGPNPCMTPDPGFGVYDKWENIALGQMVAPHKGAVRADGGFDLVVHFHGHEPIRKEFVKTGNGAVLVGIDLGLGSGPYETRFSDATLFPKILESVEEHMKKRSGKESAHVRHLALSSWSAGYGATSQILRQPIAKRVEAVILLDSLHAGYKEGTKGEVRGKQIEQFAEYAKGAAAKKHFMFMSHSSIIPPGYASTTEVARWLVGELGGKLKKASRKDVLGLEMIDRFDKGDLHVRGYDGNDKPDHCAHIGLIADILKVHLLPRWKTPKGRAEKKDDDSLAEGARKPIDDRLRCRRCLCHGADRILPRDDAEPRGGDRGRRRHRSSGDGAEAPRRARRRAGAPRPP